MNVYVCIKACVYMLVSVYLFIQNMHVLKCLGYLNMVYTCMLNV